MQNDKERRYIDRIYIPGASLYYRKFTRFNFLKRFHGPMSLTDISKSTVSIPAQLSFKTRTVLDIKIILPKNQIINLKGAIRGFETNHANNSYKTVIQFQPYGYGREYNSFRSKRKLDRFLADKYA
jgi:hypothetical protein